MMSKDTWLTELEKMVNQASILRDKIENQKEVKTGGTRIVVDSNVLEKEVVLFGRGRILIFDDQNELDEFVAKFDPPIAAGADYQLIDTENPLVLGERPVIPCAINPDNKIHRRHLPKLHFQIAKSPEVFYMLHPFEFLNFTGNYQKDPERWQHCMPDRYMGYPKNMYRTFTDFAFPMVLTSRRFQNAEYPEIPGVLATPGIHLFAGDRVYRNYPIANSYSSMISDADGSLSARCFFLAPWLRGQGDISTSWHLFEPACSMATVRPGVPVSFPRPDFSPRVDGPSREIWDSTSYTHCLDIRVHSAFAFKWHVAFAGGAEFPVFNVLNNSLYLSNIVFNPSSAQKPVGKDPRCKKKLIIKFLRTRFYEIGSTNAD